MATAVIGLLGATAGLQGAVVSGSGGEALRVSRAGADMQAIADLCDEVTIRLESGDDVGAAPLLARLASRPMEVATGGTGSGALGEFSSSALFMRLGRTLEQKGRQEAARGDLSAARACANWCRQLSRQALDARYPTMASLQLARYLDQRAESLDITLAGRVGGPQGVRQASARAARLQRVWREQILGTPIDMPPGMDASAEADRVADLAALYRALVDSQVGTEAPAVLAVAAPPRPSAPSPARENNGEQRMPLARHPFAEAAVASAAGTAAAVIVP
jgi:hypothetical protein